ncbi:hypothetical protein BP5796_05643 [Coleophoma crateriformis]|uniref:BTB domain-containing protein n=1 Tax=Coleophoma crateriformis TaxID=565419 RepID=A0A3D8S3V3_9HELO|nr:hypothetical protein BP5796_05643 [Coleophoma crateriformis]
MPPRKRTADEMSIVEETCKCERHSTQEICDSENHLGYLRRQRETLSSKVLVTSPMARVKVDHPAATFEVCQGILEINSGYFAEAFDRWRVTKRRSDHAKPRTPTAWLKSADWKLEDLDASCSHFISWAIIGAVDWSQCPLQHADVLLWQFGNEIRSPEFQDYCLDHLRQRIVQGTVTWPSPEEAALIYKITRRGSPLRALVADSLASKNPFQTREDVQAWAALIVEQQELSRDVLKAGRMDWRDLRPVHNWYREKYAVDLRTAHCLPKKVCGFPTRGEDHGGVGASRSHRRLEG